MSGKKSKGKAENLLEQEEVLQALVIADSFNEQFAPITRERPRVSEFEHATILFRPNTQLSRSLKKR